MDGARLLNACVATGISARDMAAGWDSVWIDFTKGLGAPIGAALAGSREFIDQVWRWKQRLGGALRQGGIAAAGCLHALDHHIDRLADDHANARTLARGLSQIEGLDVQQPETNLVYIGTKGGNLTPAKLQAELRKRGVLVSMLGGRVRACLHLDVTAAMVEETVALAREIARAQIALACSPDGAQRQSGAGSFSDNSARCRSHPGYRRLLPERVIDDPLQHRLDALRPGRRLHHQDDEHVFLRIDPEIGAERAVPFQFADRARRVGDARARAHRKAEAEAKTVAGKIIGARD